jgi:hypothetical protein
MAGTKRRTGFHQGIKGKCLNCQREQQVPVLQIYEYYPHCRFCNGKLQDIPTWHEEARPPGLSHEHIPYPEYLNSRQLRACEYFELLLNGKSESVAQAVLRGLKTESFLEIVVQANLFVDLRKLGLDAQVEVWASGHQKDRFDIVVFEQRRAVRIIEVKKRPTGGVTRTAAEFVCWHKSQRTENQLKSYRAYGIPVDLIQGAQRAKEYLSWLGCLLDGRGLPASGSN